jgi:putrescine transport system ATP-binding protein
VWVALRPEKVRLGRVESAGAIENSISGRVWDIAYRGDLSLYQVRLDNGFVIKVAAANTARLIERPISFDDQVWLSWGSGAGAVLTR